MSQWSSQTGIVTGAVVAVGTYAWGAHRLRGLGPRGRALVPGWQMASFTVGVLAVVATLVGPMDEWADHSFPAHMGQHMLLVLFDAPLIVLGSPLRTLRYVSGRRLRRTVAEQAHRSPAVRRVVRTAESPGFAAALAITTMAAWHVPALFDAALNDQRLHAAEHTCFLGAACLFWSALIGRAPRRLRGAPAVAYALAVSLPMTGIAAILTLATTPMYPAEATVSGAGASALHEQQLAGLVMWVPGDVLTLIGCTALALSALRRAERADPGVVVTLAPRVAR